MSFLPVLVTHGTFAKSKSGTAVGVPVNNCSISFLPGVGAVGIPTKSLESKCLWFKILTLKLS